jgi:uroporphyrinogen III methyltransferase/synthase
VERGVVCFVGVGPGDPSLRTERASQRIAAADRVVTDDVSAEALIDLAREGNRVVRIVAGDVLESPIVVAQALAVARAGVALEVVPGVGARGAAAAFAGVLGRAVRVAAEEVARALADEAGDAMVTIIQGAGSPSQQVTTVHVRDAPERVRTMGDAAVILSFGVPEDGLRWCERRPLFGKRVLVTRAREQAGGTAALLRDYGADPVVVPTIEIHPPSDPAPLAKAIGALRAGAYGWAAFTSANGVDRTWEALVAAGGDARAFGSTRLAAIGPATSRALEQRGLRADVVAKEFRGELLAEGMLAALRAEGKAHPGERSGAANRVLIARAARARDVLPEALRAAGCAVDVVAAYETHAPPRYVADGLASDLREGRIDAVMFTSSSTVDNLCDLLGPSAPALLSSPLVASIGPITTATAEVRGLRVDVTARIFTVAGLVESLVDSQG